MSAFREYCEAVVKLDNKQLRRLEALSWLVSPKNRQSGRSTLLALAFLRSAFYFPGEYVHTFDHHESKNGVRNIRSIMKSILKDNWREILVEGDDILYTDEMKPSPIRGTKNRKEDNQILIEDAMILIKRALDGGFEVENLIEQIYKLMIERIILQ